MERLKRLLLNEDPIETQQRLHNGININDMGLKYGPGIIPKIPHSHFFSRSFITATKQHRYSYMPAHTHSFIEFNYQFSGHSIQQLNGHQYVLQPGELLVMDRSLIQRYGYMGTHDLLVNVLVDPSSLPTNFFTDIKPARIFGRFLYNALDLKSNHDNFLIYDLNDHPEATQIWQELMYYCLTNSQPYQTRGLLLKAAVSCLPDPKTVHLHVRGSHSDNTKEVLAYIEQHYSQTTLRAVSKHFGYNQNYLGNKIKRNTGMSFGELLDRKRLLTAESMLLDTNWPLDKIAEHLGYRNTSSLFRLFNNKLHRTPTEFRREGHESKY